MTLTPSRRQWKNLSAQEAYALNMGMLRDRISSTSVNTDRQRENRDRIELHKLVDDSSFLWCLMGVHAIVYWGVPMDVHNVDYVLCIPDEQLSQVQEIMTASQLYNSIPASSLPGREAYMSFPRFKLAGVDFAVVFVPTSAYDLNLAEDCEVAEDINTGIKMRILRPDKLIHALLYFQRLHGFEAGYSWVSHLLMHNSDDAQWTSESLLDKIINQSEKMQLQSLLTLRDKEQQSPEGVMRGKWINDRIEPGAPTGLRFDF